MKRPNAIAVNAAICSQEQLVHFVGKGAVIPLAGNSAGMQQVILHTSVSHVLLVGLPRGFLKWTKSQGPGILLALATFRERVRATCVGQLLSFAYQSSQPHKLYHNLNCESERCWLRSSVTKPYSVAFLDQ